jgi:hypothetical protein
MVEEYITVVWCDGVHKPPGTGEPTTEDLAKTFPEWKVEEHSSLYTVLKRLKEEQENLVLTGWNGTLVDCKGRYCTNLQQLRDAKGVILKLAEISGRDSSWLNDKECIAEIQCNSLPVKIVDERPDKILSQLLKTLNKAGQPKPTLTAAYGSKDYVLSPDFLGMCMRRPYPEFENWYENFSKMFEF